MHAASASPRRSLFWDATRREIASDCREMFVEFSLNGFLTCEGGRMPRMRKSSCQPFCQYDAYLAGCAFTLSVVLVTFMLIAHGVHF
jgi:hypothetical protein